MQTTTKISCNLGGNEKDTKVGTLIEGIKFVNILSYLGFENKSGKEISS